MRNLVLGIAAMFVLAGCSSVETSTEGVEVTRVEETATTTESPEPDDTTEATSTTESTIEPELDIPSDEELIEAATWGGRDFFSLTATDFVENHSSECTQSVLALAGELAMSQAFLKELAGVDELHASVASIEYQAADEALVFNDLVDGDGNLVEAGLERDGNRWIVEDGDWRYADDDCKAASTCDAIVAGTPVDAIGASQCSWDAEPDTINFVSERTCDDGGAYLQVDRPGGGAWIGIPGGEWTELDRDSFTFGKVEALCSA